MAGFYVCCRGQIAVQVLPGSRTPDARDVVIEHLVFLPP